MNDLEKVPLKVPNPGTQLQRGVNPPFFIFEKVRSFWV